MSDGWIRLHRKVREHQFWQEPRRFSNAEAWIDLLLSASHEDHEIVIGTQIMAVKRGQVLTSQRKLAQRWGWDRETVSRYLKLCLKLDQISRIQTSRGTSHGYTLITIRNYSKYQNRTDHDAATDATTKPATMPPPMPQDQELYKNGKKNIAAKKEPSPDPVFSAIIIKTVRRLNELTGADYRPATKATVKHIRARLAEGFTENDLLAVIEDRCTRWRDDSTMRDYLRPSTLFNAEKFESYLQAARATNGNGAGTPPKIKQTDEAADSYILEDGSRINRDTYRRMYG